MKVICVDDSYSEGELKLGQTYSVLRVDEDGAYVLQGGEGWEVWPWSPERFVKAPEEQSTEISYIPTSTTPTQLGVGNNPKQGIGSTQLPMGLVSPLFKAYVACAKHNGKGKYGLANFVGTEVLMSIYLDAAERHLDKLKMGEWLDPVDNVPHIGAIGACLDIITAARAAGTLIDDRPRSDGQLEAYYALTPLVKELTELHKGKDPYHYYMVNKEIDEARKK